MNASFMSLPAVLLTLVLGVGITRWDWDPDGILLPETESAQWVIGCDCAPRAIVNIRMNASVASETLFKGEVVSWERLRERLGVFADRWRDEEGWSVTKVLIRADRRIPWSVVRRVLNACQDPDVRIYKVLFSVRRASR